MKYTKILSLICFAALVLSCLSSCTVLSSTKDEKTAVMTVGEYEVPYELYYYITENLKKSYSDEEEIKAEREKTLVEIYSVFALGEDLGISFDDEYIASIADDAAKFAIEDCGGKSAYKKALAENYMNDSVYRFLERYSATAAEALKAVSDSAKIPKDDEGIAALAMGDEFIRVKQILVIGEAGTESVDDTYFQTKEPHTDEEALAIAKKACDRAKAGEDFDSLVKEYGESLYMFNNTDGYYICRGMWEQVNEDAAFALDVGEVSDVIESESGYSVFLRCEKSERYIEEHADDIREDYCKAQYELALEKIRSEMTVTETDALSEILEKNEK
ncbi:MAG: peptidylprolyl isomerase [Clostridia bacterium]|nr:peptidylprolyl isomerase [Clostridia bacterium]